MTPILQFKNHWKADDMSVANSHRDIVWSVWSLGKHANSIKLRKVSSGMEYKIYNLVHLTVKWLPQVLSEQKVSLQEAFKRQKGRLRIHCISQCKRKGERRIYHTAGMTLWDRMAHMIFPDPENNLFPCAPIISSWRTVLLVN